MVAKESQRSREISTQLVSSDIGGLQKYLKLLSGRPMVLDMPERHPIYVEDFDTKRLERILIKAHEEGPQDFERLLAIEGVGPKTIRALALVSELVYGARPSFRDPARFSFAHGGKDGYPYPVDRSVYDQTIAILEKGIKKSTLSSSERFAAL